MLFRSTALQLTTWSFTINGDVMNDKNNELYRVVWTQVYETWPQPKPEPEITDLTEARAVLARIMAK